MICSSKRITRLLLIQIGLVVGFVSAADIQLLWDPSPTPDVTYMIYGTTNTMSSTNLRSSEVKLDTGTNQTVTIRDMKPGRWTFAATAIKSTLSTNAQTLAIGQPSVTTNSLESDPSNFLMIEVPAQPGMLMTVYLEASVTLVGTNWNDVGFFKVRIQK